MTSESGGAWVRLKADTTDAGVSFVLRSLGLDENAPFTTMPATVSR